MFERAAEIIKDVLYSEEVITEKEIAVIIERYFDDLKDEINNDPQYFFKDNYYFWKQLDEKTVSMEKELEQQKEIA